MSPTQIQKTTLLDTAHIVPRFLDLGPPADIIAGILPFPFKYLKFMF